MKTASVGYAKLGTSKPIKLRAPGRILPIVVVPGFMGSRLSDPVTKKLAWNPTGFPLSMLTGATPGPFAVDFERLQQVSSELVPDEFYPDEDRAAREATKHIKNYSQIIPPYYGDLSKALANDDYIDTHAEAGKLGVKPRVYCCGYDWRQDNAKSALRLAAVVDDALRETGEDKCILVVHSNGGLVARHYCRALGGESKVFAVFSIASPMLGAPGAYTQLKHGAPGLYAKEYYRKDQEDPGGVIADNLITEGMSVLPAIQTMASSNHVADGIVGFIGPVYLALTLGAGRLLTRRETVYFARQIPSAYQLLPGALFCNAHRMWNFFDPLNTALPPSGYLIKLPTLLDATVAAGAAVIDAFDSNGHKAGSNLLDKANQALHGDDGSRSNVVLEGANSESIEDMVVGMVDLVKSGGDGLDDAATSRLKARILTVIDRFTKSFMDCRNSRALYSDIFTGLLDSVALRGISAYNLELAYRFDDSLTVQPREESVYSAASLLGTVFGPVVSLIGSKLASSDPAKMLQKQKEDAEDALAAERAKPKAYVHPRTIAYANNNVAVDGGCILACLDVHSNYDSNFVKWELVTNPIGLAMPPPKSPTDQSALYYGDGTVPYFSARPPDELLSHPLVNPKTPVEFRDFTGIMHTDMSADSKVLKQLKLDIAEVVPDWYKGVA